MYVPNYPRKLAKTNMIQTMVIVDTYALNVHNDFWGEDSRIYRPSRFLGLSSVQVRLSASSALLQTFRSILVTDSIPDVALWVWTTPMYGQIPC